MIPLSSMGRARGRWDSERFGFLLLVGFIVLSTPSVYAQEDSIDNFDVIAGGLFAFRVDFLEPQSPLGLGVSHFTGQLSGLPRVSSAGSFAYRLSGVVPSRPTEGYGPVFTERAFTIGRHRLAVGYTTLFTRWGTLDDLDLRNGFALDFYRPGGDTTDLERSVRTLHLAYDGIIGTAFFGVTDRFDLG